MNLQLSGNNDRRHNNKQDLNIATWNVRTMLYTDSRYIPQRRTALIDLELENTNSGIAGDKTQCRAPTERSRENLLLEGLS